MQGIITKIISNQYQVTSDGRDYNCVARGKVRLQARPLVGDRVVFTDFDDQYGIERLLPRRNMLKRPAIANVDQVLLVMSATDPEFSTTLIDRLSFMVAFAELPAHILVTKLDLVEKGHPVYQAMAQYRQMGFKVVDVFDTKALMELLDYKITVLSGQSGVGKSTCLNRLNTEFRLVTQATSKALHRGKHTTRFTCLYPVGNGLVADTPGFSSLDWSLITAGQLADCVVEWREYIGQCKYRDCLHESEPGCKIKALVSEKVLWDSRYQHYLDALALIRAGKGERP